jgi:hypothetical protein
MTIKPTIKWGIWCASACLTAYAIVFALRATFPGSEQIWSVFRFISYPMIILWDISGLVTHDAPRWNTWFDASTFLFSAVVGFGVGALAYRIKMLSL